MNTCPSMRRGNLGPPLPRDHNSTGEHRVRVVIASRVATVMIESPPVNALAQPVRAALLAAIERLEGDPGVDAVVIHGSSGVFVAGADITEFDAPPIPPMLVDVVAKIESCSKPVVALIEGYALGGGLELAMGCHYRIATLNARLGLPEIKLGLLPGAGGTQRLPRLVETHVALEMMLSGEMLDAPKARLVGLIDDVIADESEPSLIYACRVATSLAKSRSSLRRVSKLSQARLLPPDRLATVLEAYSSTLRDIPSAAHIVECVRQAGASSFSDGVAFASHAFEICRTSTVSRALRYVFFAERAVRKAEKSFTPECIIRIQSDICRGIEGAVAELRGRGVPDGTIAQVIRRIGWKSELALGNSKPASASDESVLDTILSMLRQTGITLVDEGSLASLSDFDMLMIRLNGFPRHGGGPIWLMDNTRIDERMEILR